MKKILWLIGILFMSTACNPDLDSNISDFENEESSFSGELAKMSSEHDEDLDADSDYQIDNTDENGERSGRPPRRAVRRFLYNGHHFEFRQDVRELVSVIFDTDEVEGLSEEEEETGRVASRKCRQEIRQDRRDQYDHNEDDHIDPMERLEIIKNRLDRRLAAKDQFDSDGSGGELSDEEKENRLLVVSEKIMTRLLEKYDSNNDGLITNEEATAEDLIACVPFEEIY